MGRLYAAVSSQKMYSAARHTSRKTEQEQESIVTQFFYSMKLQKMFLIFRLSQPERIIYLGDCFSEGYLAAVDGVQQREDAENPQQQPQQPACGWHLPQVRVDIN